MLPPQQSRLTDKEHRTVCAILKAAFDDGISLDSRVAVEGYLKGMLSENLLLSCGDEIFACCLRLRAERNGQLHSPSYTDTPQLSTSDTSQEGDDSSENSELGSPLFVSGEPPIMISFFCPSANEYRLVSMRSCKGKVSYISESFARQQLGAGPKPNIILNWSNVGSGSDFARTRCELIHRDHLSSCDVALAEDHGKKDPDVVEGELAGDEHIINHRSNEASGSPEAAASPGFAAEQDPDILTILAELNVQTAIRLANSKRKLTPPAPFESSSGAQHKRMREA